MLVSSINHCNNTGFPIKVLLPRMLYNSYSKTTLSNLEFIFDSIYTDLCICVYTAKFYSSEAFFW